MCLLEEVWFILYVLSTVAGHFGIQIPSTAAWLGYIKSSVNFLLYMSSWFLFVTRSFNIWRIGLYPNLVLNNILPFTYLAEPQSAAAEGKASFIKYP